MDYEKKYNEALERARKYMEKGYDVLMPEIFPELAESEDERIIEEIKFAVMQMPTERQDTKERCIAYLEKQKEQPKEELVYRLNGLMQDYIKEGKDDEEKEHRFKCYQLFWDALEDTNFFEQKEQKPEDRFEEAREKYQVEWSEEDEMYLQTVIGEMEVSKKEAREYEHKTYDTIISWLKSLRPSWKPSEDEERLINTSISFLKDFADKGYENAVECIDWLKSKLNGNSGK